MWFGFSCGLQYTIVEEYRNYRKPLVSSEETTLAQPISKAAQTFPGDSELPSGDLPAPLEQPRMMTSQSVS